LQEKYRRYEAVVKDVLDPTGRRTSKLCIEPFTYNRALFEEMRIIARSYHRLLEFVFQNFPVNAKIQEVLEYPADLENYLKALNIYPTNLAAARVDLFMTKDGLKMVESNCEIPGGNEESYFLEQQYLEIFQPEGLRAVPRMEIVYDTLLKYYGIQADYFGMPRKDRLFIVLTQWQAEIDRILGEYDILMNFIRERGHEADVIDPNLVSIRDNKAFHPDGRRIDLIYRRFTADELPRFAEQSWQMAIDWDQAEVAVVNPLCTKRVDSKNIMVLYRDEQYDDVFPPELAAELAVVRKVIPWTKKIKPSMVLPDGTRADARPWLLANREGLVIKHANAYASAAVFIGIDTEATKWEEIVDQSLEGDWIVQEVLDLPEMDLKYFEDGQVKTTRCIFNVNPYMYDGRIGGFLNRASTDKLTSFKSGEIAAIVPCFERVEP
jgi:hypothetical protein